MTTTVSRRQAYIESDGTLFRIIKGTAEGEWARPTEVAYLNAPTGQYFAFTDQLSDILKPLKANTVYHIAAVRTKERMFEL